MSDDDNTNKIIPWHREQYVWLVIFFPVLAVIGGIITIILAIYSNDGLVVDDYYKKGLEINRTLKRDQIAHTYRLVADVELRPVTEEVTVTFSSSVNFLYPESIHASFLNATRAGLDRKTTLFRTQDKTYRGHLAALKPGKWYVYLQQNNWRVVNTIYVYK